MDISLFYTEVMECITPFLVGAGIVSLTISIICMLLDIVINAFTGKGLRF